MRRTVKPCVKFLALPSSRHYYSAVENSSARNAMAGASLLTLLDDIASVLDDVALLTKAASKKTAGVLGDDIALNAQQVSGVVAKRELPVVRSEEHTSELQSLMRISYAVFCLKKKNIKK